MFSCLENVLHLILWIYCFANRKIGVLLGLFVMTNVFAFCSAQISKKDCGVEIALEFIRHLQQNNEFVTLATKFPI